MWRWGGLFFCVCLLACDEEQLVTGYSCDFEGRCPGELACTSDFTCELPGPACRAPEISCAARCVDLQSDSANCGACGSSCTSEQTCSAGTCTGGGNMSCAFCGPGVPCLDGACDCQGRGELCSMVLCVDLKQANISCGACFAACPNSGERCLDGACVCPTGEKVCDQSCVVVRSDPQNCGDCGVSCASGQRCEAGACVANCAQPQSCGSGSCYNVTNDPLHCGSSCQQCQAGAQCVAGACTCPSGSIACSGSCVDTLNDALHCGSCTTACVSGEACSAGTCVCQPGLTRCGATCAQLLDDPDHCGACGTVCAAGQLCSQGTCVSGCPLGVDPCTSQRLCRSGLNPLHCGGCDSVCDPGEVCLDDSCVAPHPAPSCTGCPCEACDDQLCCLNGAGKPTCVDSFRCPVP